MRPVELFNHNPAILTEERASTATAAGEAVLVAGLSNNTNLDNYISDLEDLAYRIYRYLNLQERSDEADESELLTQLQHITNNLKNLAAIYTNCTSEAVDRFRETQHQIKLQLGQYPDAIANLQRQLLKADRQVRQLSESVMILTAAIDCQIAFDTSLKNDAQRKARRLELIGTDSDYITASVALRAAQDQRESLLIELQLLRNQFSILKLDRQDAIAAKQLTAIDAA